MYKETLRRITSLSLLTILLTSSVAFAMPNALPQAHAATNANLFVSAENSQFQNYFAGPQVIQVIVADPDINRLDQAYGEPQVTVNGKRLRMAQATDGNWYGYFADRNAAIAAGNTVAVSGKGLNFGGFCGPTSTFSPKSGVDYTETKGFTLARGGFGSTNHTAGTITTAGLPACATGAIPANGIMEHTVRQNKTLNQNTAGFNSGAVYQNVWPVIQLYDFSGFPTTAAVDYHKAGGDQIVNLTFDRIPTNLISTSVDRTAYPVKSQVFVQLNDPQLNIDPTEEDSWTWGANATNSTLYYMAFNRNGGADADGSAGGMHNLIGNLTEFMFNHNGQVLINPAAQGVNVLDFQKNGKEPLTSADGTGRGQTNAVRTASIGFNSAPVTFIETGGVNTGTFGNWDGGKKADLVTSNTQTIRGQSATIRYNDVSTSIVGGFGFASLSVTANNNTWASGQKIPVTLTDTDANRNSKITEHLDLFNPAIYNAGTQGVPTMTIGKPLSLANRGFNDAAVFAAGIPIASQSGRATVGLLTGENVTSLVAQADGINVEHIDLVTPNAVFTNAAGGGIIIDSGKKMSDLLNTIHNTLSNQTGLRFKGLNLLNYDLRSLTTGATGTIGTVKVYLVYNETTGGTIINPATGLAVSGLKTISLANSTSLQDLINLNETSSKVANGNLVTVNLFHNVPKTASIGLLFTFTGTPTLDTSVKPIAADFFSVGLIGDGTTNDQRINNAIYRWELEETGDNTSTFTGTTEYLMLNQLNVFDPNTYSTLRPISHQVKFVAIQDMLQSESRAPQITYQDLGADGQFTPVSAQQDILTHTGVLSFDSKTYKIADTVTITLKDADLNGDNDLIDIYTSVKPDPVTQFADIAQDIATDTVGKPNLGTYQDGTAFGRMLDIQFGPQNIRWSNSRIASVETPENTKHCFATESIAGTANGLATSFSASGFALVETGPSTGIFTGTFAIPDQVCKNGQIVSTFGQNIKVNYVDFRNATGNLNEISDNAFIGSFITSTVITPNPSSVIIGNSITFTASVSTEPFVGLGAGPGGSVPILTGLVTFSDGEAGGRFSNLGSCTLSPSGSCTVTYTPSSIPRNVTITGSYLGDTIHRPSSGNSTLTVLTPTQAAQNLIITINNMNLKGGETNSLNSKLQAAITSLNSNNPTATKNHINAFINEVNAQTGKNITAAQSAILIQAMQNILNATH